MPAEHAARREEIGPRPNSICRGAGAAAMGLILPGQQHREQTRIDESGGERWLCSQDEAQAAG